MMYKIDYQCKTCNKDWQDQHKNPQLSSFCPGCQKSCPPIKAEIVITSEIVNPVQKGLWEILTQLYHQIDLECISETDTVRMSTIKQILVDNYGVDPSTLE